MVAIRGRYKYYLSGALMQVPILNGTVCDTNGNYRQSYPHNLIPVPIKQGISGLYLKPAEGIIETGDLAGGGFCRGGINWNGVLYRVIDDKLVRISSANVITVLGTVGNDQRPVSLDYSFDQLSITSNGDLFYWNGTTLTQVTDPDLGEVKDHIWVDGYFMAIDNANLVVTEIGSPTSILPTRYGSSEADPDPTIAIRKLRNEPYVLNRYTIEAFQNVGGTGFPFSVIEGAQVQRGCVGTYMCAVFLESIAFVGSGRNESIAVWIATGGNSTKISTREIDLILENYTETTLSNLKMEARTHAGFQMLYIHLTDITLVYDAVASTLLQEPVWYTLGSGIEKNSTYRARYFVWCYDSWTVGDPLDTRIGYLTDSRGEHWGEDVYWQFDTDIFYADGYGILIHELELVGMGGRIAVDEVAAIQTQYSFDGLTFSQPKTIEVGASGNRDYRMRWLSQGHMRDRRTQRFKGSSKARLTFARLEARIEQLEV